MKPTTESSSSYNFSLHFCPLTSSINLGALPWECRSLGAVAWTTKLLMFYDELVYFSLLFSAVLGPELAWKCAWHSYCTIQVRSYNYFKCAVHVFCGDIQSNAHLGLLIGAKSLTASLKDFNEKDCVKDLFLFLFKLIRIRPRRAIRLWDTCIYSKTPLHQKLRLHPIHHAKIL